LARGAAEFVFELGLEIVGRRQRIAGALFVCVVLDRLAELAAALSRGLCFAGGAVDGSQDVPAEAFACGWGERFFVDDVEQVSQQRANAIAAEVVRVAVGELGLSAVEPPGGGAPMGRGCLLDGAEPMEAGLDLGVLELLAEGRVSIGFAEDRAVGTADIAGGATRAGAGEDEGDDFTLFDDVQNAGRPGLDMGWFLVGRRASAEVVGATDV
jgi:hypothetical protein